MLIESLTNLTDEELNLSNYPKHTHGERDHSGSEILMATLPTFSQICREHEWKMRPHPAGTRPLLRSAYRRRVLEQLNRGKLACEFTQQRSVKQPLGSLGIKKQLKR